MVRAFLFAALLAFSACSLTPLQLSAINYQGISTLQDAVVVKQAVCVSQGKDECNDVASEELVDIDGLLASANQYDDFRINGLFDAADVSLASAKSKARALADHLSRYIPEDQRVTLEWADE